MNQNREMDREYAELSLLAGLFASAADSYLDQTYFVILARENEWNLTLEMLADWKTDALNMGVPADVLEPTAEQLKTMPGLVELGRKLQAIIDKR